MGKRENKVETYFDELVESHRGITRKWVSPGHVGVPDRIAIFNGHVFFVEVKTTDGELSEVQIREHIKLRIKGVSVYTLCGHHEVDDFIRELIDNNVITI